MSIHHGNGWIICGMGFQCFDSPTTCSFKFSLKFLEEYYASSSPDYWLRGHVPTRPIGVPWTFLLGWPGSHGGTLQKFPQNLMFLIKFLLLFDFTGEGAKPPSCPPPSMDGTPMSGHQFRREHHMGQQLSAYSESLLKTLSFTRT